MQGALVAEDSAQCHTLERLSCAYTSRNNAAFQATLNAQIELENYAKLVEVETCVRSITFPLWKGSAPVVIPVHCPRYTCDSSQEDCSATLINEFSRNSTLNGCTNSTQECVFNEAMVLDASENFNVTCSNTQTPTSRRYYNFFNF